MDPAQSEDPKIDFIWYPLGRVETDPSPSAAPPPTEAPPPKPQPAPAEKPRADIAVVLFRVAWLSIALGLAMEFLFVGVDLFVGNGGELKKYIADFVQKVSWSLLVCVGLALGTAASHARAAWMGIAGLLSAPLAFTVARSLHKSATQALSMAAPAAPTSPSPVLMASLKAAEYAFLGIAIAVLAKKGMSKLGNHVVVGLAAGLVFGGTIVGIRCAGGATLGGVAALALNELMFPIGCSVVLFAARALGRRG
jgi:hypothetical protein